MDYDYLMSLAIALYTAVDRAPVGTKNSPITLLQKANRTKSAVTHTVFLDSILWICSEKDMNESFCCWMLGNGFVQLNLNLK